jgi:hypothetical protein
MKADCVSGTRIGDAAAVSRWLRPIRALVPAEIVTASDAMPEKSHSEKVQE